MQQWRNLLLKNNYLQKKQKKIPVLVKLSRVVFQVFSDNALLMLHFLIPWLSPCKSPNTRDDRRVKCNTEGAVESPGESKAVP